MNSAIALRVAGRSSICTYAINNVIRAATTTGPPPPPHCLAAAGVRYMSMVVPLEPKKPSTVIMPFNLAMQQSSRTDSKLPHEDSDLEFHSENSFLSEQETTLEPKRWDCERYDRQLWVAGVQVLSVKITEVKIPMTDEDQIGVYGWIAALDSDVRRNYLYRRERSSFEYVKLKEDMELIGPSRGICCDFSVFIQININFAGKELAEDKSLAKGEIEIVSGKRGNQIETATVHGKYGAVKIKWAYISRAMEATVEIHSRSNSRGSLVKLVTWICGERDRDVREREVVLFDRKISKPGNHFLS